MVISMFYEVQYLWTLTLEVVNHSNKDAHVQGLSKGVARCHAEKEAVCFRFTRKKANLSRK